jgi:hypothetical protein
MDPKAEARFARMRAEWSVVTPESWPNHDAAVRAPYDVPWLIEQTLDLIAELDFTRADALAWRDRFHSVTNEDNHDGYFISLHTADPATGSPPLPGTTIHASDKQPSWSLSPVPGSETIMDVWIGNKHYRWEDGTLIPTDPPE